jgi:uncharacterized membrane protein
MNPKITLAELTQENIETMGRIEAASEKTKTRGEHISDVMADWIGSWPFIIAQSVILAMWILLNVLKWAEHWDPYPFTLLNLALSFEAAFFGPIIMISQNRQSRLIERRNKLDLQINLLAEQENTELLRLLRLLCEQSGIKLKESAAVDALAQETKPEALITQIEKVATARG